MQHIKTITVKGGQTVPDIAIQEYGNLEAVVLVLQANPGLSITTDLTHGQELIIWTDVAVQVVTEILSTEPYASNLQQLLMQWSRLITPGTIVNNTVSNQVVIPQLDLELSENESSDKVIVARYTPGADEFLKHSPKIWLFRWTKGKRWMAEHGSSWESRVASTRWRHPSKFSNLSGADIPVTEFTLDTGTGNRSEVLFNPSKWARANEAGNTISMTRKSRPRLEINIGDDVMKTIRVNFGLAIVINNPENYGKSQEAWVRPYKIWGPVSRFRLNTMIDVDYAFVPPHKSFMNTIKLIK